MTLFKAITKNHYFGVVPGLIALMVYLTTTCRSIWIGDSGEFALAFKTLGICHPPGYPLFTLLGRFFVMLMPFVRVTFAANIYNVLIASATAVAVYYLFKKYLSSPVAAIFSLIWALSPLFWAETAGVEVYALNMLLIVLTLLAAESKHRRKWIIASYLFGLSLANHPTALAILPVLIYLFVEDRAYRNIKLYPFILAALGLAGSLYLYLLIRSACGPLANWGNPHNIKSLIDHMTLTQYSGWIEHSWDNIALSVKLAYWSLLKSWGWPGLVLSAGGFIIGFIDYRARTIIAFLILVSLLLLSSSHQALNFEPFYLPALLACLILIGNVVAWLEKRLKAGMASYALYAVGIAACLALLVHNYSRMDKSAYTLYEDYSRHLLDTANDGILLTAGDINSFGTLYLRYVENYKRQVEVYDRSIRLAEILKQTENETGRRHRDYYSAREDFFRLCKKQIYLAKNHYIYEPDWLKFKFPIYSYGMLYALKPMPDKAPGILKYPVDYDPDDVLSRQLLVNFDLAGGESYLKESPVDTTAALTAYNRAYKRLENEPRAIALNNLGIYYRGAGYPNLAYKTYNLALTKPIITQPLRRDILYNISNIFKDKGNNYLAISDYRKASANFIEALNYDPENSDLLLNIGLIFAQALNDTSQACDYLQRYLKIKPAATRVKDLLENLNCPR